METKKDELRIDLDPKIQELYAKLEEEKKKNERLQEFQMENARLIEKINQLKTEEARGKKLDAQKTAQRTRKKIALQEQLQEKKLQDQIIANKQYRIEELLDSIEDQEEINDLDSKSIEELKAALDSLIAGREKRKDLIRKLNAKNQTLLEENEKMKFIRSNLAHDLRSLMASILGTFSLIDLGEREVIEQLIPTLEARCHLFMKLMDTINSHEVKKEIVSIESICNLLNLETEEGQTIKTDIAGQDVLIFCDKAALYDVIQNLVNNSKKYAGLKKNELEIRIEVLLEDGATIIKIADNGCGIAENQRKNIFDLYDRAGRTDQVGKGLGLFMVKKLVENHGGHISYDDNYADGAQFIISLPEN